MTESVNTENSGVPRRIGIMGGTFDPIHNGHLILGEAAWQEYNLDTVIFLPSGNPPHKRDRSGGADNNERLHMTELATEDNPHFFCSDLEMHRSGFTYTYETLMEMKAAQPLDRLFFIIGADSLFDFEKWRCPEKICTLCTLLVAVRNHVDDEAMKSQIRHLKERFHAEIYELHTGNIDISSAMLRQMISKGMTARYYIPDKVRAYIEEHRIYQHTGNEYDRQDIRS